MSRIFISYRREDSAPYAGRLYDRLASHLGKDNVFIDIDTIGLGLDFVEVLEEKISKCDAVTLAAPTFAGAAFLLMISGAP